MFRVGVYRVPITPPVGTYMAGFGARVGPAQGVHDDLFARAIVVDRGSGAIALVACDALYVSRQFTDAVRAEVEARTAIPRDHVLVCATHTHSGPDLTGEFTPGTLDPALGVVWQHAAAGCIEAAWRSRADTEISVGLGSVQGIGVNRRTASGEPVDPEVRVVASRSAAGDVLGVLVNYTCHPVVLGPDNLLFSADYPGYMQRAVEQIVGPGATVVFTNGAEGDVNTGHSADLSGIGAPIPGRTFERAGRLGRLLAGEVLKVLSGPMSPVDGPVGAVTREIGLELRQASLPEATDAFAAADAAVRRLESTGADHDTLTAARIRRFHAQVNLGRARQRAATAADWVAAELQALRVGALAFVAVPGEMFVELGLEIKRASPFAQTFVVGLANGAVGYLPTRAACEAGGYEAVATPFVPWAGETVRDTCLDLLRALHDA
ncbi:MAG TPA: neutral/alkaline non-lysosomal ceramidase N-terminal domain-containing protein [bacterium]|nr:neutral/alkaline non-lysosomal ceramidase N-terminal domain-containing protein [bacterium]